MSLTNIYYNRVNINMYKLKLSRMLTIHIFCCVELFTRELKNASTTHSHYWDREIEYYTRSSNPIATNMSLQKAIEMYRGGNPEPFIFYDILFHAGGRYLISICEFNKKINEIELGFSEEIFRTQVVLNTMFNLLLLLRKKLGDIKDPDLREEFEKQIRYLDMNLLEPYGINV